MHQAHKTEGQLAGKLLLGVKVDFFCIYSVQTRLLVLYAVGPELLWYLPSPLHQTRLVHRFGF